MLRIAAVAACILAAGCSRQQAETGADEGGSVRQTVVQGSLTYRERIPLPTDSVAQVTVSPDAAAPPVASTTVNLGDRQVPIPFELTFDAAAPRGQHVVEATIVDPNDRLIWTTDTPHPLEVTGPVTDVGTLVLRRATRDNAPQQASRPETSLAWTATGNEPGWRLTVDDEQITLLWNYGENEVSLPRPEATATATGRSYHARDDSHDLRVDISDRICRDTMSGMPYPSQVSLTIDGNPLAGCGGSPASLLQGDEWAVEDIAGKGMVDDSRTTLKFGEDGRLTGTAGCNAYGAAWHLSGEGMTIEKVQATLMACTPALDNQERKFLRLLKATHHFEIADDGALLLHAAEGATITARRE